MDGSSPWQPLGLVVSSEDEEGTFPGLSLLENPSGFSSASFLSHSLISPPAVSSPFHENLPVPAPFPTRISGLAPMDILVSSPSLQNQKKHIAVGRVKKSVVLLYFGQEAIHIKRSSHLAQRMHALFSKMPCHENVIQLYVCQMDT